MAGGGEEERNRYRQDHCKYVGYMEDAEQKAKVRSSEKRTKRLKMSIPSSQHDTFGCFFSPEMAKGPISNVYITGGSSANGARYPGRWDHWLIFSLPRFHSGSIITTPHPLLSVTAAPTAPWPPAQTTLTTAAPVWRRQFRTWGMTTTRMSTTKTTTKTNLSEPHHSNKHSPTKPPSQWEIRAALWPDPPPVRSPHTRVSVWPSQGCRLPTKTKKKLPKKKKTARRCSCSWSTRTAAPGAPLSRGTCCPANMLTSFCLLHFSISHPATKDSERQLLLESFSCPRLVLPVFVISKGRRVDPSVPEIAKVSALMQRGRGPPHPLTKCCYLLSFSR